MGFEARLWHLLSVSSWAHHALSLHFGIHQMGTTMITS